MIVITQAQTEIDIQPDDTSLQMDIIDCNRAIHMIFTMILIDECHHAMSRLATADRNEGQEMIVVTIELIMYLKFHEWKKDCTRPLSRHSGQWSRL